MWPSPLRLRCSSERTSIQPKSLSTYTEGAFLPWWILQLGSLAESCKLLDHEGRCDLDFFLPSQVLTKCTKTSSIPHATPTSETSNEAEDPQLLWILNAHPGSALDNGWEGKPSPAVLRLDFGFQAFVTIAASKGVRDRHRSSPDELSQPL